MLEPFYTKSNKNIIDNFVFLLNRLKNIDGEKRSYKQTWKRFKMGFKVVFFHKKFYLIDNLPDDYTQDDIKESLELMTHPYIHTSFACYKVTPKIAVVGNKNQLQCCFERV